MSLEENQCLYNLAQEVMNADGTTDIATHGMSLAVFVSDVLSRDELDNTTWSPDEILRREA